MYRDMAMKMWEFYHTPMTYWVSRLDYSARMSELFSRIVGTGGSPKRINLLYRYQQIPMHR